MRRAFLVLPLGVDALDGSAKMTPEAINSEKVTLHKSEIAMIRQITSTMRRSLPLLFIGMLITGVRAQESQRDQQLPRGLTNQNHSNPTTMTATASIPFEFWIGPEKMPPGQYVLEIIVPSVATLRRDDGRVQQELFTLSIGGPVAQKESRLIFVLRNEKLMLSEIWCVEGKRRLTSQAALSSGDRLQAKVVSLSYP